MASAGKQFRLELEKIVGQIKYRPTLKTWENNLKAAQKLEGKYDEWRLEQESDIQLFSPSAKKILRATYDSITYINEGTSDVDELKRHLMGTFSEATKDAEIAEFRHVGNRRVGLYRTDFQFNELVEILYEKFYSENEELKNISGEQINDVVFIQNGRKNQLENRVHIGPMSQKEARDTFNKRFTFNSDPEEMPAGECYLFLDVDVYKQTDIDPSNMDNLLDSILRENRRIIDEYLAFMEK